MNPAPVIVFLLVFAVAGLAQTSASKSSNSGSPRKAKKEFAEPKWMMAPVQGSNLHYRTFDSKTAREKVSYLVYLPPDYDAQTARRYPVVYWLHGIGGSQQGVPQMAERLTKAIGEGKTPPMIVVYVNGMIRSGYVDSADGKYPVETVTITELIPHVDATYRTIATREGRIVEGFSMGGGGAAKWGFKYPELFGTVSILAGALHSREQMAQKNDRMAEIYGSAERFEQSNPWALVEKNADRIRGRTVARIAVGGKDGLLGANTRFHELLERLKIEHDFEVVPDASHSPNPVYDGLGDKNWAFWRKALARANANP
jgi:endo-1,4-beta-xylanase